VGAARPLCGVAEGGGFFYSIGDCEMFHNGQISCEELAAIEYVLGEKLSQYDRSLTELMIATRHERKSNKMVQGQLLYW
jgi:hypothetical protein